MVLYGVRLLINIFDLFIYRRFLEVFIGKRKTSVEFSIFLLIACEVVGSAVNQLGINWLNLITMVVVLSIYICQYEASLRSKIITVFLYMGLVVIAEPIGYIIYIALAGGVFEHEIVGYYFVVFVMEVFLLLVVELFCKIKAGKNVRVSLLPKEIAYTLALIPFNENNPNKPMQYGTIQSRIVKMIREQNIRDDNGNLFGFGSHLYRHYYGVKLTEMHLDDWTIAKLLGHSNLKNVKYYRKMSNQILADDTRKARKRLSDIILQNLDGWGDEYEQIRQDGGM